MQHVPSATITPPPAATSVWLLLVLGEEVYGIPGAAVREVMRYRAPLFVPGAPAGMPGLLNQRGVVLTVVDLRPLLNLPITPVNRTSRYVVAQHDDADIALLAERVLDLVEIAQADLEPLPAALDPARARLLRATARIADQLVVLIDIDALLAALREEG